MKKVCFSSLIIILMAGLTAHAQQPAVTQITETLKKAATFYREKVARHGGYVYYTAADFSWRHGEGAVVDSQIWVQPPGTPTVGMAYLAAFEATNDEYYLSAAVETAEALCYGQLQSGAWTNSVCFDESSPLCARYRNGKGDGKGKNFSTLDDGISQAAIEFLVGLDAATGFKKTKHREAVKVALDALLQAQFANGAFPQGWDETPADSGQTEAKRGNFPKHDWRTEGRMKDYWDAYTLNDDLALSVTKTLLKVIQTYPDDDRYLAALKRFGDFLIISQMPEPQPGWAQQYNYDLQPIWARKFEPAAISGRETEGVIAALMQIAVATKDKKYLDPIPAALAWLKRSALPGRKMARYYELETNRPLYMERKSKDVYVLTNKDDNLPDHYGWKNDSKIAPLEAGLKSIYDRKPLPDPIFPSEDPAPGIAQIIGDLTAEGAWISTYSDERLVGQPKFKKGDQYIDSEIFSRNIELLSRHLKSLK
jgi:PelA/Pel-15E family pectate lyase